MQVELLDLPNAVERGTVGILLRVGGRLCCKSDSLACDDVGAMPILPVDIVRNDDLRAVLPNDGDKTAYDRVHAAEMLQLRLP